MIEDYLGLNVRVLDIQMQRKGHWETAIVKMAGVIHATVVKKTIFQRRPTWVVDWAFQRHEISAPGTDTNTLFMGGLDPLLTTETGTCQQATKNSIVKTRCDH